MGIETLSPPDRVRSMHPPMKTSRIATALGLLLAVAGCSSEDAPATSKKKSKDHTVETQPSLVGAAGVTVHRVAIYQGVERTLELDGAPQTPAVPLIAGRDALVRVFYSIDAAYDGQPVTGRLEIDGGDPIDVEATLGGASVQEDVATTVNFFVPGDRIGDTFVWSVGVMQLGTAAEDNLAARYPAAALTKESLPVEGKRNTLRVIVAPFRYDTDGSGRLPDTSPPAIEALRARFKQLYPVSDVQVSVREPTPWNQAIKPDGTGWQEVGYTLYGFRAQDGTTDDVYYYGMFNPAQSLYSYCGGGCLLGVTLLNNDPPETGTVGLRLAIGVGFPEVVNDTAAHEIGHAHGREHANCGYGIDPQSIDHAYPYDGGLIGSWGLDPVTATLYPPNVFSDLMGYCEQVWISDYNYKALFARTQNVNLPVWHGGDLQSATMVTLDGHGGGSWRGASPTSPSLRGVPVTVQLVHERGPATEAHADWFAYDHLPGGWLLLRDVADDVVRVDLDHGGGHWSVAR